MLRSMVTQNNEAVEIFRVGFKIDWIVLGGRADLRIFVLIYSCYNCVSNYMEKFTYRINQLERLFILGFTVNSLSMLQVAATSHKTFLYLDISTEEEADDATMPRH